MKISVVMATYNGKDYLYEQLDSIRDQTQKADEVLLFDDGSTDETVQMAEQYIKENHLEGTWKMTVNEHNLGYADNFHQAMMAAGGDYIFFCDQDDIWMQDKIKKTVSVMEQHPEVKLLCTDYEPFSSAENAPTIPAKIMRQMKKDGSLEKLELNSRNIYIASLGCVMCLTRKFRDEAEPYWKSGWAHDDYVWKMSQCADGCYVYHEPLIRRRLHGHNVSMKKLHTYGARMQYLLQLKESHMQMLRYAELHSLRPGTIHLLERCIQADGMRAELLEKRKFSNCLKLLFYMDCYHSRKSLLVEPYMALKCRR